MIKIERISPKAVVRVDGNVVSLGYGFPENLLDTLQVENGEVLYSVHEKTLEYKWSEGCEGASRPKAVASETTKELKTDTAVEKDNPHANLEPALKELANTLAKIDAEEVAEKVAEKVAEAAVKPRKAILGK